MLQAGSDSAPNPPPNTSVTTQPAPSPVFSLENLAQSLLPAIQSGSYVIVIVTCFIFWLARKELLSIAKATVSLIDSLKDTTEKQTELSERQEANLEKLSDSYQTIATLIGYGVNPKSASTGKDKTGTDNPEM